ncbi:hypothetical protein ACRE_008140 [Hapsidospora chrysogenum ATCC 11550]|uniref:Uncharacterized protein n=1 Tax=Hapsidospora chrysogenum (strain ATCC 11550 / CBS 779.69 / DSM 880 / IAM 14645 / JCM 23072 / IMI 49137) TaxID=857340 RepID=A0A086TG43_HAPC1|nr:hypothetical protein ACRE_008140 [Hapsidospora chrysogenum ATCC 11550]
MLSNISFVQLRQNMQSSRGKFQSLGPRVRQPQTAGQARWAKSIDSSNRPQEHSATILRVPDEFEGSPESAGFIAIGNPHFQRISGGNKAMHFEKIPYLGSRSDSGSLAVEHNIFLFTDSESTTVMLYLTTVLETDLQLKMRYFLTLDDAPASMTRVLED